MIGFTGLATLVVMTLFSSQASGADLYSLQPGSTFSEGCVPPCRCAVWGPNEVYGTFVMGEGQAEGEITTYPIEEISWKVTFDGEIVHEILGSGTYRIGGTYAPMHQLELDLNIDSCEPEHLDSGLVPGGLEFPSISIPVSRGTECRDIWMEIEAAPAGLYIAGRGSIYTEGCVPPCDCPTWMGKLRGRFSLSPSGSDPLFRYYDIENITWIVFGFESVMHRITGRGTYRIGGEFALMHQMELDIVIDGAETEHLDSGLIAGGAGFPRRISISLARGTFCYDISIDLDARKRWGGSD